ncbi:MAG TPA: helix-turn-helix transcriptional regulator [Phycisphaerae bacterium]|nr:helix-turn-helix transcriptional regulator [Phycisphaerae bacterium]
MTLHEKLERLTETANRSAVSRKAGLPATTLNSMLARHSMPTVDTIVKLARALEVDVAWLIDDQKMWPAVRTESPAQSAA